jgi:hypothetical protein
VEVVETNQEFDGTVASGVGVIGAVLRVAESRIRLPRGGPFFQVSLKVAGWKQGGRSKGHGFEWQAGGQ